MRMKPLHTLMQAFDRAVQDSSAAPKKPPEGDTLGDTGRKTAVSNNGTV
jgi:hypothetical protein